MTTRKGPAARKPAGRGRRAMPSMAVRRACFLEVLRRTGNVSEAAREAGLASSTAYAARARHTGFARDWDAAIAAAMDELESVLMRRAMSGVEKPVFFRGEQIGSVRTYSDSLAMFLLRARRPEVYDRLSGGGGAAGPAEMTQEEAKREVFRRLDLLAAAPDDDGAAGEADGAAA